jgi:hypothetical protein
MKRRLPYPWLHFKVAQEKFKEAGEGLDAVAPLHLYLKRQGGKKLRSLPYKISYTNAHPITTTFPIAFYG